MRAALFIVLLGTAAQLNAQESIVAAECSAMFKNSLSRFESSRELSIAANAIYKNACSGSNRNLSAGFDSKSSALIYGVPTVSSMMGRLNISSNKQFCEMFESGALNIEQSNSTVIEPVIEAMEQANACMQIASTQNLVLTHAQLDPGRLMITGRLTNPQVLVSLTALTSGGFVCRSPRPNSMLVDQVADIEIKRNRSNFNVICERPAIVSNGNQDYPLGGVVLSTGQGNSYKISVRPDSVYGVATRNDAEARITTEVGKATKLKTDLDKLRSMKRTVVFWHYGDGNKANDGAGQQFSCGARGTNAHEEKICPSGKLTSPTRYKLYSGDACGYAYYAGICEQSE